MKIEISDTDLEKIIRALDFYYAYTAAQRREDPSYIELANRLKRKEPQSEKRAVETRSKIRS